MTGRIASSQVRGSRCYFPSRYLIGQSDPSDSPYNAIINGKLERKTSVTEWTVKSEG